MKTLNTKLILSALGIALLATPALAQRQHHQAHQQIQGETTTPPPSYVGSYPNGATRSGSIESRDSGAEDNLNR